MPNGGSLSQGSENCMVLGYFGTHNRVLIQIEICFCIETWNSTMIFPANQPTSIPGEWIQRELHSGDVFCVAAWAVLESFFFAKYMGLWCGRPKALISIYVFYFLCIGIHVYEWFYCVFCFDRFIKASKWLANQTPKTNMNAFTESHFFSRTMCWIALEVPKSNARFVSIVLPPWWAVFSCFRIGALFDFEARKFLRNLEEHNHI